MYSSANKTGRSVDLAPGTHVLCDELGDLDELLILLRLKRDTEAATGF